MTERPVDLQFADRLASHGVMVSEERLAKHWRDVEGQTQRMARRERRARLTLLILGGLTLAGTLALLFVSATFSGAFPLRPIFDYLNDSVAAVVVGLLFAVPVTLLVLLFTYFLNHRRRLRQAEHDQIVVMLIGLEHQVKELRRRVDRVSSESSNFSSEE